MKKKVLSSILCAAMAATMVVGCGFQTDAPTEAPAEKTAEEKTEEPVEEKAEKPDEEKAAESAKEDAADENYEFEIIVKSSQSSYWQAVVKGVEQAASELGVTCNCIGPNDESDIAGQVSMLNNAINKEGVDGIGITACDQSACLKLFQSAMEKGIPVVCFDAGVADAPAGSVYATVATDNYSAGATAAENLYTGLKDVIEQAPAPVRIGEINEDAASESIINRGLGFIDKFAELAKADGKTVAVIGNDKYKSKAKAESVAEMDADIIIEVAVSGQATAESCAAEATAIMNRADTIGMFGSSQVAAEGILSADNKLGKLGIDPEATILAAGFDSGTVIKAAIKNGKMYGAVTRSPFEMGFKTVQTLLRIAKGEVVPDIFTDGCWYNAANMEDDSIAPNLYD